MVKALVASVAIVAASVFAAQAQTIQKKTTHHGDAMRVVPLGARAQAETVTDRQDLIHVKPDGTAYPINDPTPHYMRIYHGAPYGE